MEITRFGVLSIAKIFGATYAIIGLIAGLFFALAGSTFLGVGFGFAAIIILPLFYGIMGFIGGAIFAAIYNFIASKVGGIVLETRQISP